MYYGKTTDKLLGLRKQYREIFSYDPDGDMELEFGENDYEEYVELLKTCIETKRDMFEVLGIEDDFE